MPIHKLANGKYRWGEHGHVYSSKEGALKQAQAAYANGYREKGGGANIKMRAIELAHARMKAK